MAGARLRAAPRRPRESGRARRERTGEILARLSREHPDAICALAHADPFQLLVATILSAQCTDERVNQVTPALFARYPDAAALAAADLAEVEELVRPTGFFRNKARALVGLGRALAADHGGAVPATMEELVRLPGVGRKTANVVLGNAFGVEAGVVVDTHVARLSHRLGLAAGNSPEAIERELAALVPQEAWTLWSHLLIFHGRRVCPARRPRCSVCVLADLCPSAEP